MLPNTHKDTLVYMGVLGGLIGVVTYQIGLSIKNMGMLQSNLSIILILALPLFWSFFTIGKNSEFKDRQLELLALWSAGLASFFACALYISFAFSGNPTHTIIYMFIVKLIAIPYALVRINKGVWVADYQKLHDFAWDRPLAFGFGVQLLFIVALLLGLWGGLFHALGIKEFATAFSNPYFIAGVIGSIMTVGILLAHMQSKIINSSIQFLDMTAFFVLPVLAAMAVLFVAMLPLTAANFLLKAEMISAGLLCLAVASIVCVNCVVRIAVRADMSRIVVLSAKALCGTLPCIVVLAAIPIIQDAYNFGLSPNRINGLIFVFFALLYGVAYIAAIIRGRVVAWDAAIRQANIRISLLILCMSVVMVSSLFPVYHVATAHQKHRLLSGAVAANDFDYWALAHDFGRPGEKLIDNLRSARIMAPDMQVVQERISVLDKSENKYQWERNQRNTAQALMSQAQMVDAVAVYPAGAQLPAGARTLLLESPRIDFNSASTRELIRDKKFLFYVQDLNGDTLLDVLIFGYYSREPLYLKNTADGWQFARVVVLEHNGASSSINSTLDDKITRGEALKSEFVAKGLGDENVFIIPQD